MEIINFDFDMTSRGDRPVLSVIINGKLTLIYGPPIYRDRNTELVWRTALIDAAKQLEKNWPHHLIKQGENEYLRPAIL